MRIWVAFFFAFFLTGSAVAQIKGRHDIYDSIKKVLLPIGESDQVYRNQLETTSSKYGAESKEMKSLYKNMVLTDSANLITVSRIIAEFGWLGADEIGDEGNSTLFMVIQHADLKSQEYFLPLMKEAVVKGKAKGTSLALLEDRIALKNGKDQIYGSQISWNMKTGEYFVMPIEDPDNVDKRRKAIGLVPIAVYIMDCCNLVWDLPKFKSDTQRRKKQVK